MKPLRIQLRSADCDLVKIKLSKKALIHEINCTNLAKFSKRLGNDIKLNNRIPIKIPPMTRKTPLITFYNFDDIIPDRRLTVDRQI